MAKRGSYRVLVVGGDGRAHALYKACEMSPIASEVLCTPGNGGIRTMKRRDVGVMDFVGLVALCANEAIDIVVVSPEGPLCGDGMTGIVDHFKEHAPDVMVFGPSAGAARLEGSKRFCKQLCVENLILTARYDEVTTAEQIERVLATHGVPIVVKEDGLAGGKGVTVATTVEDARATAIRGIAKGPVIMEDVVAGREVSFICLSDGKDVLPLRPARDYKRAFDSDKGPNTGGMGCYSPLPEYPEDGPVYAQLLTMANAVADGIAVEDFPFVGLLYVGAMVDREGTPWLLEVNCRGGDPETEVLLNGFKGDFFEYIVACCEGTLADMPTPQFAGASACVVVASEGYPEKPAPHGLISQDWLAHMAARGVEVFHAGTAEIAEGVKPTGGRVLVLCANAATHEEARHKIYDALNSIPHPFPGAWWRTDIAKGAAQVKLDL